MGIRFYCPNGHKLNVKEFQAGRKGICPFCGAKIQIPTESTRPSARDAVQPAREPGAASPGGAPSSEKSDDDSQSSAVSIAVSTSAAEEGPAAAAAGPTPIVSAPLGPEATVLPGMATPAYGGGPAQVVVDPLTEAGDVVWYVRPPSGGQFGPADGQIMRTWLAEGRISADSLVWREGWRDWRDAGGVFPQLRDQQPAPLVNPASPGDANAAVAVPRAVHPKPRRVRRTKEILVIVALALTAMILIAVFVWVLLR